MLGLYLLAPGAMVVVLIVGLLTACWRHRSRWCRPISSASWPIQPSASSAICSWRVGRAFTTGIFHLATHACFKALLFLGAGSVIHALDGEQDIRRMGPESLHARSPT